MIWAVVFSLWAFLFACLLWMRQLLLDLVTWVNALENQLASARRRIDLLERKEMEKNQ